MNERRTQNTELIALRQEVDSLKDALDQLTRKVGELLDAWNTANGLLKIVKIMAIVGGGVATVYAAIKGVRA